VTVRAIAGIVAFNVFVLVVGAGVLWGLRGWRFWTELVRLLGVAYFLGLSALIVVTTLELVVGIPLEAATFLVSGAALVALGVAVGRRRGLPAPALRPPEWRFPRVSAFAALFVAGIVVYLEALFRADRVAGVAREWDSWANWLPKSRSLYLTGELDLEFLPLVPQLTSYPPGHTAIQSGAFHAMGSADTATLHLQYWFMAAFFVVAVVGLLAHRVRQAILFPVLLAVLVAPYLLDWLPTVYADLPMGYLVAVAALLIVLWIEERAPWHLGAASLLLAGAMLTKREGMLFAACVVLAGLVASFAERRQLWPRLLAAGLVAFALTVPWRIWVFANDLPSVGSDTGYDGAVSDLDRLWPAFEIGVRSLVHEDVWFLAPLVGVAAVLLAALGGAWRVSVFAAASFAAGVAAVTWVLWVNHGISLVHDDWAIRRLIGTPALMLAALTPLLLQRAWSSAPAAPVPPPYPFRDYLFGPSLAAWCIVLVGLLSHPGSALVGYSGSGLPGEWMSFPGESCDPAAANVREVVGYAESYPEAEAMRERARAAGAGDVRVSPDGCGRVRVYVVEAP
jgi:hypothetical protein